MQALPTGVYGPLPPGTVGLLLGRSSATLTGILVEPGVIDQDFTREIKIMTHSPAGISVIQSGQRIAQLLLLPQVQTKNAAKKSWRGDAGFGSSDAYWIQAIGAQRPELVLTINGKNFQGLLDTGANVSVFTADQWPRAWPKQPSITQLQGIGQSRSPEQSSNILSWKDAEGHHGTFQPYIVPGLPVNLWGRDVMRDMGVYLFSPSEPGAQQMSDQGLLHNQGLGENGQGIQVPLMPVRQPPIPPRPSVEHF